MFFTPGRADPEVFVHLHFFLSFFTCLFRCPFRTDFFISASSSFVHDIGTLSDGLDREVKWVGGWRERGERGAGFGELYWEEQEKIKEEDEFI